MSTKIKFIQITKENFPWISSKIKKFFNKGDVVHWHNFDCGNKFHIQPDFVMNFGECGGIQRVRPIFRYNNAKCTIVTPETEPRFNKEFIRISLNEDSGGVINIGDHVGFAGNRLHVKSKAIIIDNNFIYDVYQLWDKNGGFKDIKPSYPIIDIDDFLENDYL